MNEAVNCSHDFYIAALDRHECASCSMASLIHSFKVDANWQIQIFIQVRLVPPNFLPFSISFSFEISIIEFPSVIHFAFQMARIKQATPLRRDPSSEYFSKGHPTGTPSRSPRNLDRETNGSAEVNGHTNELIKTLAPKAQKEAGALQFLIAVGGIYGSL
jgi:hypothetical protein